MRFFNGNIRQKDPSPSSSGEVTPDIKITGESGAAATIDDTNGTAWHSSSANGAKSSRSKHEKISRRSSMDSVSENQRKKDKDKTLSRSQNEIRPKSSGDRASLDRSGRQELQRSGPSDPPIDHSSSNNKERKEKKKKKKQLDAPQEGGRGSILSSSSGSFQGEIEHKKSLKDASFQDVLKNLNGDASNSSAVGRGNENNPFVVSQSSSRSRTAGRHMPTLDENQQDNSSSSTKLDFSGFKSQKDPTSAIQALLENANFSSDCSVGTMNTTTQCALSLGHLIEEMQVEFQKLKKQKNKAESYAEKLHTDYVRMQEGLERDFEKACQERDEHKIAREKDTMAINKLKEELKALKSENTALKESMRVVEERSRKAEEENGRMKIALEALLVRSGALNKDGKPKQPDGGIRRGKIDRAQDQFNDTNRSMGPKIGMNSAFRRRSTSESGSLPCTPEKYPSRQIGHPKSADYINPVLDSMIKDQHPKKAVTLPFDSLGNRRSSPIQHPSAAQEGEYHNCFDSSDEISNINVNRDEDDHSFASNHTNDADTIDTPTPR